MRAKSLKKGTVVRVNIDDDRDDMAGVVVGHPGDYDKSGEEIPEMHVELLVREYWPHSEQSVEHYDIFHIEDEIQQVEC